jgi:DNA-binding GntR family transcriptional regulator
MICEQSLSKTISFFASSAHGNNDLRITVLEKKTVVASDEQCRQLQITAGSEMHFYSRLCRLGDTPAFIEHEYVSAERFPNLWEHDIAQLMFVLFGRVYDVKAVRDHVVIKQLQFSADLNGELALEKSSSGLILEQTVFDDNNCPISISHQYWRGDLARFTVDINY